MTEKPGVVKELPRMLGRFLQNCTNVKNILNPKKKMADACECICSYQWAMRRLMQILNQAQTYCTEDDCQDPRGQVRSEIHALLVHGPLGASW